MTPYLVICRQSEFGDVENFFCILLKAAPTNLRAYWDSWTFLSAAVTFSSSGATLIDFVAAIAFGAACIEFEALGCT